MKCYQCKAINAKNEATLRENWYTQFLAVQLQKRASKEKNERGPHLCAEHCKEGEAQFSVSEDLAARANAIERQRALEARRAAEREATEKARRAREAAYAADEKIA